MSGGSYGWKVDRDALFDWAKAAIEADQTGEADLPCSQTANAWNGVGGRDWGARYIDIDLSAQHACLFDENGEVIWESDIVSGKPRGGSGSLTPTGVYVINSNSGGSTLEGTNDDGSKYKTPVTYWMPFVGNLIGLHDASWAIRVRRNAISGRRGVAWVCEPSDEQGCRVARALLCGRRRGVALVRKREPACAVLSMRGQALFVCCGFCQRDAASLL